MFAFQRFKSAVFSVVLLAMLSTSLQAADRNWYSYYNTRLPKSKSVVNGYTYVIFCFNYSGRYFTTGKKYFWRKEIFHSAAVSTAARWKRAGHGVHVFWYKNRKMSTAEIERKVADLYDSKYGKGRKRRPIASGKKKKSVASVKGTVWYDRRDAEEPYWWFYSNGKLEVGSTRRLSSNARGTWRQVGNKIYTKVSGYKKTFTIDGNTLKSRYSTLSKTSKRVR